MSIVQSQEREMMTGRPVITTINSEITPSSQNEIDQALEALNAHKDSWATLEIQERIVILEEIMADLQKVRERWIRSGMQAQSLNPKTYGEAEHMFSFALVYRTVQVSMWVTGFLIRRIDSTLIFSKVMTNKTLKP